MRRALQRGPLALSRAQGLPRVAVRKQGLRYIQVRAAPSEEPRTINGVNLPVAGTSSVAQSSGSSVIPSSTNSSSLIPIMFYTDARFDVIGSPYSMLSISLSASQNLYTRRGTLVGLSGKSDNV
jgi:hypothetical protein